MSKPRKNLVENQLYFLLNRDVVSVPNILLRHYKLMDLNDEDLLYLIAILGAHPQRQQYFNFSDVLNYYEKQESTARRAISVLLTKNMIVRLDDDDNYSIQPLFDKMLELVVYLRVSKDDKSCPRGKSEKGGLTALLHTFEKEFGRPLSPVETEKVTGWLLEDKYPADLIAEALNRAVLYSACSLVYIDKILQRWRQQGIKTVQDAYAENERKEKAPVVAVRAKSSKKVAPPTVEKSSGTDYDIIFSKGGK